ncbi:hypothetical protein ABT263_33275 [Kitasatospora sp. NPDC001603]|uniref:hypothetical protein n=1 Tax=Kitasatospora sp. NPDC001603 TaxID=3154388 RepID=UPI00331D1A0A
MDERIEHARRLCSHSVFGGEADVLPGVAANLVGLAYIAAAEGCPADARALLDEAAELAAGAGAKAVLHSIDEARAEL